MDRYGVIWTRATGTPVKIADMTLTPRELRIAKTQAATEGNVPGVSLLHDLSRIPQIEYLRTENHQLPPQLAALLPPNDAHNPQRRILAALLERGVDVRGMPLLEKDWHMLMFAGRNGAPGFDSSPPKIPFFALRPPQPCGLRRPFPKTRVVARIAFSTLLLTPH
ncbi:MAG: hypothetical protein Q8O33_13670, partial [Pseudomonadota bacterium]|nr:hypothetical protein [Pseudomonadota bacterium]